MRTPNCVRDNEERSFKGLTLRLNVDTLAVLDKMKEDSGMSKGAIVDKAVMLWHKYIYAKLIDDLNVEALGDDYEPLITPTWYKGTVEEFEQELMSFCKSSVR